MIKTTPRASDITPYVLGKYFTTLDKGSEYVLNAFGPLFIRTLGELKGIFTDGELSLIIDTFNATALTPRLAGRHIIGSCRDAINGNGLDKAWVVDKKTFLEKIKSLTIFQAACLEIWANGFWYGDPGKKKLNLEEYIKNLSGDAKDDEYLQPDL